MNVENKKIAIIGLGYVGLPLAVEFAKYFRVTGFDLNENRISELSIGNDNTNEITPAELSVAVNLKFTNQFADIKDHNVYIVTVPTPVDRHNSPDLRPLLIATEMVASLLNPGDLIIYESTVYPGATEEECVPLIERISGLVLNEDFFVGYSPERINPGDKTNRLTNIRKITSGSNKKAAQEVDELYGKIIEAGTYVAPSIKVAEASKVIENTQRDINIALINEVAIICNKLQIDTLEVLKAAETKWNFLPFRPGLVGGHCIGVDPYYLVSKAESIGYNPSLINAARRVNSGMGSHVTSQMVKALLNKKIQVHGAKVLILGFTFKENCPDTRNTRVIDVVRELEQYGVSVEVYDPWINANQLSEDYKVAIIENLPENFYDGAIVCVAHDYFVKLGIKKIRNSLNKTSVIYDLKDVLGPEGVDLRL